MKRASNLNNHTEWNQLIKLLIRKLSSNAQVNLD